MRNWQALVLGHRPLGHIQVCRGRLCVPCSGLAVRERGEVRARQLGAWLPHVEPCAYGPNRRDATGCYIRGELLGGLGL